MPIETELADTTEAAPLRDIDLTVLRALGRNDRARIERFVALFLQSADRGMTEIDAALAAGDHLGLQKAGHRMKSSARAIGAAGFAGLCADMEDAGRTGMVDSAQRLQKEMTDRLTALRVGLTAAGGAATAQDAAAGTRSES